jgi:uncharacterized protein YqjF (DUF2071 family)
MSATPTREPQIFLTAEWRYLAMLNYEIDPALLVPMVPAGTELDSWNGKTFLSLVGFLFRDTRISGFPIPFHRHFEEVNLRFYVSRKTNDSWRRGVVFIKEIVPKRAVAFVARTFYNENYITLPMRHRIERNGEEIKSISYNWRYDRQEFFLRVATRGEPQPLVDGSLQEFVTEHYWGYATQRDGSTKEYRVEHPRWNVWETDASEFHCDVAGLYGNEFCKFLDCPPSSAFLADGSPVKVYKGAKLLGTSP